MFIHTQLRWKTRWQLLAKKKCDLLDSSGMLIQHSGILLALSLSRGYNFEVCAVEPPCTRVEAETGDKALTS